VEYKPLGVVYRPIVGGVRQSPEFVVFTGCCEGSLKAKKSCLETRVKSMHFYRALELVRFSLHLPLQSLANTCIPKGVGDAGQSITLEISASKIYKSD
jgi:hypothetical protein